MLTRSQLENSDHGPHALHAQHLPVALQQAQARLLQLRCPCILQAMTRIIVDCCSRWPCTYRSCSATEIGAPP